jgi:threonine dehydratase
VTLPDAPTMRDVLAARRVITRYLPPTPLWSYPALSNVAGAELWLKHENAQPTGAFKVRGGINLLSNLAAEERDAGVVSASTGNHGQSLAYAALLLGLRCTIVMPEPVNPSKRLGLESLGADIEVVGDRFDESRRYAAELAERTGARYVHPANEPLLVAGVATLYLEIFERQPDLAAVFVPIGGGSGAAGACLVAEAVAPGCDVIAVQSSAAPAAYESYRAGRVVSRPNETAIEGVATGEGFELPLSVLRGRLADFLVVADRDVRQAQYLLLTHARTLAEGAGAVALAGFLQVADRYAGKRVGVAVTGGNASPAEVEQVLAAGAPA